MTGNGKRKAKVCSTEWRELKWQEAHLASFWYWLNHGNWHKWCLSKRFPKENGQSHTSKPWTVSINASFIQKQWTEMGRSWRDGSEEMGLALHLDVTVNLGNPEHFWDLKSRICEGFASWTVLLPAQISNSMSVPEIFTVQTARTPISSCDVPWDKTCTNLQSLPNLQ